jgi:hypothetical protein
MNSHSRGSMPTYNNKKPFLILGDSISTRMFFECGIVSGLYEKLQGRLEVLPAFDMELVRKEFDDNVTQKWLVGPDKKRMLSERDVLGKRVLSPYEQMRLALDKWLDDRFGYYSLAMRQNIKYRFNEERWRGGHKNPFLNPLRARPFPHSETLFWWMYRWYFNGHRYLNPAVLEYLRNNASYVIFNNVQFPGVQPYLLAAHRLGIPVIAYIGSWDHPLGKGIISPYCIRYLVQNAIMKDALVNYHQINVDLITETGWPQADLYARKRKREVYLELLRSYGLDPNLYCVLVAGNTETNAPYEPKFLERLVAWHEAKSPETRSIIFRPHPRDIRWKTRFERILNRKNVYVQAASFTDVEIACLLLQNVDCVVTNAGTILLDSVVNGRPVVCVLYDEGAPAGSRHAVGNISGHWYRELVNSGAYYKAGNFDEAVAALNRCQEQPDELAQERTEITRVIMGNIDGKSSQRVIESIAEKIV